MLVRSRVGVAVVVLAVAAGTAQAQVAPLGGHHAGAGLTPGSAAGSMPASVGLNLPAPRGDLPVPLSVVHVGGSRVGVAGAGWDVPLSFVRRSRTIDRRKPAWSTGPLDVREQISLSLHGTSLLMTPSDRANVYTPWLGERYIELEMVAGDWVARDENGREYLFVRLTGLTDGETWYLKEIRETFGTDVVVLEYDVHDDPCNGNRPQLSRIHYTHAVSSAVPLYDIQLHYTPWYDDEVSGPPAVVQCGSDHINVLARWQDTRDGEVYERTHIISSIDVRARDNHNVIAAPQSIRSYWFDYEPDADTRMPRLARVRRGGVGSTGVDADTQVVAEYEYGAATDGNSLAYTGDTWVPRDLRGAAPDSLRATSLAHSTSSTSWVPMGALGILFKYTAVETVQLHADFTGDGLPDLVYWDGGQGWLVPNLTGWTGTELDGPVPLGIDVFPHMETTISPTANALTGRKIPREKEPIITETWTKLVDWNGDGRLDVLSAFGRDEDHWKVYINRQDPSTLGGYGVRWDEWDIAISQVRDQLDEHGVDWGWEIFPNHGLVPLERSKTWAARTYVFNFLWKRSADVTNPQWVPDETPHEEAYDIVGGHNAAQWGEVETLPEWQLADVNADGFLDFAFNGPAVAQDLPSDWQQCVTWDGFGDTTKACTEPDVAPGLWPDGDDYPCTCYEVKKLVYGLGEGGESQSFVMYNRAGALQHDIVFGVDAEPHGELPGIWRQPISGGGGNGTLPMDVNGDGFLDAGEGSVASDRHAVCNDLSSDQDTFETRQVKGLVDVNGDGLPDRVTAYNGWKVAINTGAGFRNPVPISASIGFELSRSVGTCDGDMKQVAGLLDIDGDGKPEVAKIVDGQLHVARIDNGHGQGALDAGRLVGVGNGHGAWVRAEYVNAKSDDRGRHQTPSGEIVVGKRWTEMAHGLGTPTEATYFGYGYPERRYDPIAGRWASVGYRRTTVLAGEEIAGEGGPDTVFVAGNMILDDRYPAVESDVGYAAFSLTGRQSSSDRLEGVFPTEAVWTNLALELDPLGTNAQWREHAEVEYDVVELPTSGPLPPECWDANGHTGASYLADVEFCRRSGIVYAKSSSRWRGTEPFDLGRPNPHLSDNVATMTSVEAVDAFARPTLVRDHGSRHTLADDVCTAYTYAASPAASYGYAAVTSVRITDCDVEHPGQALAGVRYEYEGNLSRPARAIVERWDPLHGILFDADWRVTDYVYDNPFLRVSSATTGRKGGHAVVQNTAYAYDPFGLTVTAKTVSSNDPDLSLTESYRQSSIPSHDDSVTGLHGDVWTRSFDAYGRVTQASLQLGSQGYAMHSTVYDDSAANPSVTTYRHGDWRPAGSADGAQVSTAFLDELGRVRAVRRDLGSDYGASLITGASVRDSLGRVAYAPAPFVQAGTSLAPPADQFGSHFEYALDGTLTHSVDSHGAGVTQLFSNPADDVYVRRQTVVYRDGAVVIREYDVNDTTPGHDSYLNYDEKTVDARGRVLHEMRFDASGEALERVSYEYDRLGHRTGVHRFAEPDTGSDPVTWQTGYDSVGNAIWLVEPASPPRIRTFDSNGNLVREHWDSPAGQRAIVNEYDGFDRRVHTYDEDGGAVVAGSEHRFYYDAPSGDSAQRFPEFLLGRLSYAVSFDEDGDETRSIHYSYDQLGRTRAVAYREGDEVFEEVYERRLDGQLSKLTFRLPDTGNTAEHAVYSYDSASRLRRIDWDDGEGPDATLYRVTSIDPFGRVGRAQLGNGYQETYAYEPDGYQPLRDIETRPVEGDDVRHVSFEARDGEQRVLRESEFVRRDGNVTTVVTENQYDTLGRLTRSTATDAITLQQKDEEFHYDALGNVRDIIDHTGSQDLYIVPRADDRDRVCTSQTYPSSGPGGGTISPTPLPDDGGEIDDGHARIWIEAEQTQLSGALDVVVDAGASGGGAIVAPAGSGNNAAGMATYTFDVTEPGMYRFYGRVLAPTSSDDSFYVRIDGSSRERWNTGRDASWRWRRVTRHTTFSQVTIERYLGVGEHTIRIEPREDGTKLDRLLVTTSPSIPAANPGPDSTIEAAVEAEDGAVRAPFTYQPDTSASAGKFIEVANGHASPPGTAKGTARYELTVEEAGLYALWARVQSPFGTRSIRVQVDDGADVLWSVATTSSWTWKKTPFMVWLDEGSHSVELTEQQSGVRVDRLSVATTLATAPTTSLPAGDGCLWVYDSAGNVVTMRSNKWGTRNYSFDNRRRVSGMMSGGAGTRYAYDASGGVSTLELYGVASAYQRHERRFGDRVTQAFFQDGGTSTQLIERSIPAPIPITRRGTGAGAHTTYQHRDPHRGTRMVTDERGLITQLISYRPYGGGRSQFGAENSVDGTRDKFAGGDSQAGFDAVVMGARVYHPRTGRFLQRDPLMVHIGANALHPYSYAWNDPINHSDPTGMSPAFVSIWDYLRSDGSEYGLGAFAAFGVQFAFTMSVDERDTARVDEAFDQAQRPSVDLVDLFAQYWEHAPKPVTAVDRPGDGTARRRVDRGVFAGLPRVTGTYRQDDASFPWLGLGEQAFAVLHGQLSYADEAMDDFSAFVRATNVADNARGTMTPIYNSRPGWLTRIVSNGTFLRRSLDVVDKGLGVAGIGLGVYGIVDGALDRNYGEVALSSVDVGVGGYALLGGTAGAPIAVGWGVLRLYLDLWEWSDSDAAVAGRVDHALSAPTQREQTQRLMDMVEDYTDLW